ncbi:hypothetical protein HRbin41_01424 [bacterium HR41]|nr:hypothetical protein HRbin41_01424 [bacterium HR41]
MPPWTRNSYDFTGTGTVLSSLSTQYSMTRFLGSGFFGEPEPYGLPKPSARYTFAA